MPKIKSAKKAMRQARSRTVRNKAQRSSLRTALKHVRAAATAEAAAQKSRLAALVKRLREKASA